VCAAESPLEEQRQIAELWAGPLVALALAALITVVLLRSTAISMLQIWYGSSTYSYGFVVLPISAFLVWRRINDLRNVRPTTSLLGLGLLLFCAAVWAIGNVADVQVIQQAAFIGLLDALAWTFLGSAVIRVLRFPLLFLFFAVPAGQDLVGPLQRLTAAFAVNAVRFSGIPAVQNGFVISTPSGDWRIAEACSGIRYLTSSVLIGVLFAGIAFRSWKRRLAFVLLSAVVPVVANALRAYLIIILAYFSNNHVAAGVDHILYGWVFFSLVTATMIGVALGWREQTVALSGSVPPALTQPPTPVSVTRLSWCVAFAALIVWSASSLTDFLWSRTPPNRPVEQVWRPPADWLAAEESQHDWAPEFEDVGLGSAQMFTKDGREVSTYILSYPGKRRGVALVNSSNAVAVSGAWEILDSGFRQVSVAGKPITVAEYMVARGGERRLVWMWYLAGGEITARPYRIKLIQAESRLAGSPASVTLFAISAPFGTTPKEAAEHLATFVRDMSFPDSKTGML
jgi:exosortase A